MSEWGMRLVLYGDAPLAPSLLLAPPRLVLPSMDKTLAVDLKERTHNVALPIHSDRDQLSFELEEGTPMDGNPSFSTENLICQLP